MTADDRLLMTDVGIWWHSRPAHWEAHDESPGPTPTWTQRNWSTSISPAYTPDELRALFRSSTVVFRPELMVSDAG